jgi:hypothetical protein
MYKILKQLKYSFDGKTHRTFEIGEVVELTEQVYGLINEGFIELVKPKKETKVIKDIENQALDNIEEKQ